MALFHTAVVAHNARQKQVDRLVRGPDAINPDFVSMDDGVLGAFGNHVATLEWMLGHDGWAVVLEDDALPVADFNELVPKLLDIAPTQIVSFYLGTGYPQEWQRRIGVALAAEKCWIIGPRLMHGVCYAIAPGIIHEVVEAVATMKRMGIDDAISKWALEHGVMVSYTNPSLVDHEDRGQVIINRMSRGHFVGGRNRPRHAHNLTPRLTWTDNYVTMD